MPMISGCTCRECGASFDVVRQAKKRFCSKKCIDRWNNRRRIRGEQLYDLFMTMRYDRAVAKDVGAWALMCRMAQTWRAEDAAAGIPRSYYPMNEMREKLLPFTQVVSGIR